MWWFKQHPADTRAGWKPDPFQANDLRWWTGRRWTRRTMSHADSYKKVSS